MRRTAVVLFAPIKPYKTNASDITAILLVMVKFSENFTRFGFKPSISNLCLGSQRKPNLLTIMFSFARFHALSVVDF